MNFRLPTISIKVISIIFALLLILLLYFTRPFTGHLRLIALSVMAVGILALVLAGRAKESIAKHLLRDIGIAFVLAVVVTSLLGQHA